MTRNDSYVDVVFNDPGLGAERWTPTHFIPGGFNCALEIIFPELIFLGVYLWIALQAGPNSLAGCIQPGG